MRAGIRNLISGIAVALLAAQSWAGNPLTDSTDVKIPTVRSEVENSIAVSPLNSKVLFVSNIAIDSQSRGITTWISQDAGKTWSDSILLTPSRADPAVVIGRTGGTHGRFFDNHLDSGKYALGIHYKDTVGSTSWSHVQILPGADEGNSGADKNHLAINNSTTGNFVNYLWSGFSEALTVGRVSLKYSTNNGASWIPTLNPIGVDVPPGLDRQHTGVNLQVGPPPAARLYACFSVRNTFGQIPFTEQIGFRYSEDGGETWSSPTAGQGISSVTGFWSLPGKSMELLIAPVMAVDSNSGHIFVAYTNKVPGGDTDIFIRRSTDQGLTWSSPVRVNTDPSGNGKDQWNPWMAWDDATGALVVTYLDSRDFSANDRVNTYMAVSFDGSATWQDFKVSDANWDGDNFWGHYMGLAAKDGIAFPVWSDDREVATSFKPYISPMQLWGVNQSSVTHSIVNDAELALTVTSNWTTNRPATGQDVMVLTSPTGAVWTGTAVPSSGTSHTAAKTCTCETGDWTYIVKSTIPNFAKRGSNPKSFRINYCVD